MLHERSDEERNIEKLAEEFKASIESYTKLRGGSGGLLSWGATIAAKGISGDSPDQKLMAEINRTNLLLKLDSPIKNMEFFREMDPLPEVKLITWADKNQGINMNAYEKMKK